MATATDPSYPPLVCDMTDAPDSPDERMAEYARLFDHALIRRERTEAGLTWRFQARSGVNEWVRDLADREAACCPFFLHQVSVEGDEVIWTVTTNGDPAVEAVIDEFYRLPENVADGLSGLLERLSVAGLNIATTEDGRIMTAT